MLTDGQRYRMPDGDVYVAHVFGGRTILEAEHDKSERLMVVASGYLWTQDPYPLSVHVRDLIPVTEPTP